MPCVARHKITREKRVWRDRDDCNRWFHYKAGPEFNQADWDINDDEPVPYWGSGMMHPRPDGTDGFGPLYDTPDFKPAGPR
ncbi:hypothetical protein [Amycolatopsis sp. NPDC051128]|uniref:hypothetical protein n=1 Tax=Amycolatopsis sp. NPDC051128 TaxID=3155412 RepID=UPI003416A883